MNENQKIFEAAVELIEKRFGKNIVLTPCGICQERLFIYGGDVKVGVPDANASSGWTFKSLKEVQPYYWRNVLGS